MSAPPSPGYYPETGDIVSMDFDPQSGHEQKGRRPAIVLSSHSFNRTGIAFVCQITSKLKNQPFGVLIPPGEAVEGVILADQMKSLDWRSRNTVTIGRMPSEIVKRVLGLVYSILPGGP